MAMVPTEEATSGTIAKFTEATMSIGSSMMWRRPVSPAAWYELNGKDGRFSRRTRRPISEDVDFIALCDETLVGYIRFRGQGEPPEQIVACSTTAFSCSQSRACQIESAEWEIRLDGQAFRSISASECMSCYSRPTRRGVHFRDLLEDGRRAVGDLLNLDGLRRTQSDEVPMIACVKGGYQGTRRSASVGCRRQCL